MLELREWLIKECKEKLEYYDIVDEDYCEIEYGIIIDFLCKKVIEGVRRKLLGGEDDGR